MLKLNWKVRFYAMSIHSLFSLLLLLIALYFVFKVWYPSPLHKAMGVDGIIWLLLFIDLVIGPLLTFIVWDNKKKELKRDLIVILVLQLFAYFYGLYTVAQGRPVWQVFVIDDIELVRATDIYGKNSLYTQNILSGPKWVAAVYSTNQNIAQQQKNDEIFNGISLAARPDSYQPLNTRNDEIIKKLEILMIYIYITLKKQSM
ncbi:type4 fimbrial accessory protein [Acinetobacter variabilis]|uniref:type4 fimbrial accessory protein n=1 Tax=Acinetobacter variabilis TaxID=70346 RepID=UPI001D0EB20B|nr:type4 fimbrial accessory protein [Acinetobacter variabilis]